MKRLTTEIYTRFMILKVSDVFYTDLNVFRLKDNFGTRFHIIVSDKFKKLFESKGLTGLRFTKV